MSEGDATRVTANIRRLEPADTGAVRALLHASFDSALKPYMTHLQVGIEDYLDVAFDYPLSMPDKRAYVAVAQGNVVGYADFRETSSTDGFLSYICVDERWRRQGIAPSFFEKFCEEHPRIWNLGLDVFVDNSTAKNLYAKLGFVPGARSAWVSKGMPPSTGSPATPQTFRAIQFEQALASQHRYGFGTFEVHHGERKISVGLLGESTLRFSTSADFEDRDLLAYLATLAPKWSTAFAILPSDALGGLQSDFQLIIESERQTRVTCPTP